MFVRVITRVRHSPPILLLYTLGEMLELILSQLTIRHSSQIAAHWQKKRKEWIGAQQFVVHFGRDCSKTMALRLNEWNIMYHRNGYNSHESFNDQLKQAKVNRKAWCNKIWHHFRNRCQSTYLKDNTNDFYKSHY